MYHRLLHVLILHRWKIVSTSMFSSGYNYLWFDFISVYKYQKVGIKKKDPGSSWWCQATRQEAIGSD